MLSYQPTPLQEVRGHPDCVRQGVRLLIKREDLNHPTIAGNKWWKLKYNIEAALALPHKTILTFGGAYSNHIYATAAAARASGLRAIGLIRGEETLPLNETLQYAVRNGMRIHYVSRTAYRQKTSTAFVKKLHDDHGDFFLLPEGGSNLLAVKGCAEFAENELSAIAFDHLLVPVGTGGTMAGLICGFKGKKNIVGVSVLRQSDFLEASVRRMVAEFSGTSPGGWDILGQYHEGGYAKTSKELLAFIHEMQMTYGIPLDHVYTGKLLLAAMKEIVSGAFKRGSTVLVLHTGGLQATSGTSPNTAP